MATQYDIVVFGATGYAGMYVVEHLANLKTNLEGLSWCVAGRSSGKLAEMLQKVGNWVERDLTNVERIIADVEDEGSLNAMCKRAKCLINCVGPYNLYGEPVVRAAVSNKCHHLDLSAEQFYLKSVALNYDRQAKDANVFVIGACASHDAIHEMGVEFLVKNSPYPVNGITGYFLPHMQSPQLNTGTYHTLVTGMRDFLRIGPIDRALFPKPMPEPRYKMASNWPIFYKRGDLFNRWALAFPGFQEGERWTQYHKYTVENKRPVQFNGYVCPERLFHIFGGAAIFFNVAMLSWWSWGRELLLKYPEMFTFGVFHSGGPKREVVLKNSFEMIFEGEAFESNCGSIEEPTSPPTKKVSCRISGPDLGYVTTASCVVQAAVVLLKERDRLPEGGGVLTPGAAFSKTGYIERLQKHGVTFKML